MRKAVIAFDVDGTLIKNGYEVDDYEPKPNMHIIRMLMTISRFKNTKIIVWSGGGDIYAERVISELDRIYNLGLKNCINGYASKNLQSRAEGERLKFAPDFKPDIAIDDIQDCELGIINLIVREK